MKTTVPAPAGCLRCRRCGVEISYRRKDRVPTYCARSCVGPKVPKWDRSLRACARCNATYQPARPEQRYCSASCRQRQIPTVKTCATCGAGFRQMFGTGRFSYCSAQCAQAGRRSSHRPCATDGCERMAAYGRKVCEPHRNAARFSKVCGRCGAVSQSRATGCGNCRRTAESIGKSCAFRYAECDVCESLYVQPGNSKRRHCPLPHVTRSGHRTAYRVVQPHDIVCLLCGKTFVGKWRRVCDACNEARVKLIRSWRYAAEKVDLRWLAKRDSNRCHLCRRKVRWDVHSQHNLYPSRDHLVPRSQGGSDDVANLALAHRVCNSRRGARGAAQLRLLA